MSHALLWVVQRLTGAILFAGLALHFYIMHFIGPEQVSHAAVVARLQSPGWIAFNIAFLISAAYHGFNGLWGIALEYVSNKAALRFAGVLLWASAIGVVGTGCYILTLG